MAVGPAAARRRGQKEGSAGGDSASFNPDLYDRVTNTFSSAGANAFPRLYHSNSLLLPDATVLLMGGNPQRGNYESRLEIYSRAYLFNGDGTAALRPAITEVTQGTVNYNLPFTVQTHQRRQSGSRCVDHESGEQRHGQPWGDRRVLGQRNR